jgi:hypothetical protein
LRQLGVQPFQDPLADAAGLAHPGGGGDDEDVGGDHLGADLRPGVAAAHVELDPWLHIVVDHADGRPGDLMLR